MPFIYSLVAWLFGSLSRQFLWNTALFSAYVAASLAAVAAFFLALKGLINGIYVATPQILLDVWAWFIPSNFDECLLAVITAHVLRYLFDIRQNMMDKYLRSNT